ncbi:MAG: vWA domain-containing protein [Cyclobacteriaceae bacterium]
MSVIHHTNYSNYQEAMIGFTSFCREHQLAVGLSHTQEAMLTAQLGFINDQSTFKFALKSLFCTQVEQHETFNKCFEVFWGKRTHEYAPTHTRKGNSNISKKSKASLVMMGFNPNGKEQELEEEAKNVTGASAIESLKYTDFNKISSIDNQVIDELMEKLLRELNHRLKRKLTTTKKGKIDLRKTIRKNLSNGDLLLELARKSRKLEKYRIVLLLDVSGSMDKYSFFLLKFIWSIKSNLKNIEAFVFSTQLIRITDFLHENQIEQTLMEMGQYANNWSSGTKIGECLKDFNANFSKRILNGKSVTIVLSDGLDQGDDKVLAQEVRKIKLRTSKLCWLNPLKGTRGYEPTAKGMAAALPQVDEFASAHNFESLMQLENILSNV